MAKPIWFDDDTELKETPRNIKRQIARHNGEYETLCDTLPKS